MVRALVFASASVPACAWACPVCFSAKNEGAREAFILTTGFLTFLPLSLLGAAIYWLVRRARQLDREIEAERHELQAGD